MRRVVDHRVAARKERRRAGRTRGRRPAGRTGISGFSGCDRIDRPTRRDRRAGVPRVPGISGCDGQCWSTGIDRRAGRTGLSGFQGATGSTGPQGFQGAIGAQGFQGFQGAIGSTGVQGFQGATGAQGAQGNTGATGSQGAQGATGTLGRGGAGQSGNTGAQGAQGNTGAQGSTGAQARKVRAPPASTSSSSLLRARGPSLRTLSSVTSLSWELAAVVGQVGRVQQPRRAVAEAAAAPAQWPISACWLCGSTARRPPRFQLPVQALRVVGLIQMELLAVTLAIRHSPRQDLSRSSSQVAAVAVAERPLRVGLVVLPARLAQGALLLGLLA